MDIYLDINKFGAATAYPLALMGCYAWGESEEAALAAVPQAVAEWRADMQRYGGIAPEIDTSTLTVIERVSSDEGVTDATFSSGLFEAEVRPISQGEINDTLDFMAHVRNDLMDLLRGVDGNTLNFRPFADVPTIGQIAQHIGGADHWYTTRVLADEGAISAEWPTIEKLPLRKFLVEERKLARVNLSDLSETVRSDKFTCTHTCSRPTEVWTVRKILRRMLVHEREHIAEIRTYFNTLACSC